MRDSQERAGLVADSRAWHSKQSGPRGQSLWLRAAGDSLLHQASLSHRPRAEALLLLVVGLKAETFLTNNRVVTRGSCSAQGKGLQSYFALWSRCGV